MLSIRENTAISDFKTVISDFKTVISLVGVRDFTCVGPLDNDSYSPAHARVGPRPTRSNMVTPISPVLTTATAVKVEFRQL